MSSDFPPAPSASLDANPQENEEKRTVLKDSNKKLGKSKPPKVPAKARAACVTFHPPFCREIYNHFISAIKYGEPAYPSSIELAELGFHTGVGTSHRKRFRKILPRLNIDVVKGALVFSSNLEEEVLVHKKSGKVLVPTDIIERVVRRAHLSGSNETDEDMLDETKCKHLNVTHTWAVLADHFTVNKREFGIDTSIIYNFIAQCKFCTVPPFPLDKDMKLQIQLNCYLNDKSKNNDKTSSSEKESGDKATASSEESCDEKSENEFKLPSATARFCSMAAHIPDKKCIWYDRKSIADATNRYDKLVMVLGEMRGEMGLAVKGSAEAKQRLEAKLYCAQLLIKDHVDNIQETLIHEDSPKLFGTELLALEEEYRRIGQASLFRSDITGLLTHVKSRKLVISPLLVQEIEDFIKLQTDSSDFVGDNAR